MDDLARLRRKDRKIPFAAGCDIGDSADWAFGQDIFEMNFRPDLITWILLFWLFVFLSVALDQNVAIQVANYAPR
jgi:hypothetical protein